MREIGVAPDPAWVRFGHPERRLLLRKHRRNFLTATPEGRTRLRAWLDAGIALPPMPLSEAQAYVCRRLTVFGELGAFLSIIVRALLLAPECLRHHVLTNVVFVTVAKESRAWTSSSLLEDNTGRKARLIVLGPNADEETVIHECLPRLARAAAVRDRGARGLGARRGGPVRGGGPRGMARAHRRTRPPPGASRAWRRDCVDVANVRIWTRLRGWFRRRQPPQQPAGYRHWPEARGVWARDLTPDELAEPIAPPPPRRRSWLHDGASRRHWL